MHLDFGGGPQEAWKSSIKIVDFPFQQKVKQVVVVLWLLVSNYLF